MRSFSAHPLFYSPWFVWTVWVLIYALMSAILPRDVSYDVAHYHLHNGWSGLNGRFDQDLAPAELHSFLNPTYNILTWWLIKLLPGPAVSAAIAVVEALILPVCYYLALRLFTLTGVTRPGSLAFVCAVVGFVCVPMLATVASLRNDSWGALAYCAAILMLVRADGALPGMRSVALGALLIGLLAGMKLTNAVYVVGFAVMVVALYPGLRIRAQMICVAATTGLIGVAITGGWWMATLYSEFENPVFPLMNNVFGSTLGPDVVFRDDRYLPHGFIDIALRPMLGAFNLGLMNESDGRDLRLAAFYGAVIALVGLGIFAPSRSRSVPRVVLAVAVGNLCFIVFWIVQFSIMRYATAAFILGPTMLALAFQVSKVRLLFNPSGKTALYAFVVLFVFTVDPEPVRRIGWATPTEHYVEIARPAQFDYRGAGIIMAGPFPTAFTASAFPEAEWISHGDVQPWSKPFLERYHPRIVKRIENSTGPLFAVICVQLESDMTEHLEALGRNGVNTSAETLARLSKEYPLRGDPADCARIRTNFDTEATTWQICPLSRTDPISQQDP